MRKLRAYPFLTSTTSPALPSPATSFVRISFAIGCSLAASAGVRQERHFARVLDRLGDQTLLLHRDTGDTTGADLPTLRDELAERRNVLVVDDADADRLRGGRVLRALPRLAAIAGSLSSHCFSLRVVPAFQ